MRKRPLNACSISLSAAQCRPVLTTGIFGAGTWCTLWYRRKIPQKSAECGTLRYLRKEILYDKNTFRLSRQEGRGRRKVEDDRAVPGFMRRWVPDFLCLTTGGLLKRGGKRGGVSAVLPDTLKFGFCVSPWWKIPTVHLPLLLHCFVYATACMLLTS